MSEILAAGFRIIGLPGIIALGMLVFYEGLPIGPVRYIPYVGTYAAMLVDGRVDRERQSAKDEVEAAARARALAMIEKRGEDNAEISEMDLARLCSELGGRWVPNESRCD